MVVRGQPKEHASSAAHQESQVLVLALDEALEHGRDVAVHPHLLQCHLTRELVLMLMLTTHLFCLFISVVYDLSILQLALWDEAVGHVRRNQVHVLQMVIDQVHILSAQWVPHSVEWLLAARHVHRWDL